MSSLEVAISAIGIKPSFGTPPRTQSCRPGSPPDTPGPVQSNLLASGFATTLSSDANFPYGPRAAEALTL